MNSHIMLLCPVSSLVDSSIQSIDNNTQFLLLFQPSQMSTFIQINSLKYIINQKQTEGCRFQVIFISSHIFVKLDSEQNRNIFYNSCENCFLISELAILRNLSCLVNLHDVLVKNPGACTFHGYWYNAFQIFVIFFCIL